MIEVRMSFSFLHDINKQNDALKMLHLLKKYEIQIRKMGFYEPINKEFSDESFLNMWTDGDDDLFSFTVRLDKSKNYINFHNLKGGLPGNVGFDFVISEKAFRKEEKWNQIFSEICTEWMPHKAYISKRSQRSEIYMYETGFLRPKEIEWLNFWSEELLSKDLEERLRALEWYKVMKLSHGYLFQLTEYIDDEEMIFKSEVARQAIGEAFLYNRSQDLEDLEKWE